jgi:acyl-CoA thioesterase FadM
MHSAAEGRNVWLRDGREVLGAGFSPEQYVLARIEIDFRAEIPAGTAYVQTEHDLAAVGQSSITMLERLLDADGRTVADAQVVLVLWDSKRGRSRLVSRAEREAPAALAAA